MKLGLAQNAEPILRARMKGLKPADMVIVSLVGQQATANPLVLAKNGAKYDWRWARGLDVCVYIGDDDDWPAVLVEIGLARPAHLNLWHPSGQWGAKVYLVPSAQDVAKPVSMWKFELDFLPWMDFQNCDFMARRTYARDAGGVPHAIDS